MAAFTSLAAISEDRLEDVDRNWEHNSRIMLDSDLGQSLQVSELDRYGLGGYRTGSRDQLFSSLIFALGVNDLGPLFSFGLSLARHSAPHFLGQVDGLDLDE